jgi:hypothetical protein
MMFEIAFVFGLMLSPFPSTGCHSYHPVRYPTILNIARDVPPRIRATTNHAIPFSSTRDDLTASLSEEEESDLDSDLSSPSGGLDMVLANRRCDDRYVTSSSSHGDGSLEQLQYSSQLRC